MEKARLLPGLSFALSVRRFSLTRPVPSMEIARVQCAPEDADASGDPEVIGKVESEC